MKLEKLLISTTSMLFITLLSIFTVAGYFDLNKDPGLYRTSVLDMIDNRNISLFSEINEFPRKAGNDVLFLSESLYLKDLTNPFEGESKNTAIKRLEKNFAGFLEGNSAYYQLIYLDEKGDEVVRVEVDGDQNRKVLERNELKNRKGRSYFDETIALNKGEIFISPLELNMDNGLVENVPVMRYATPIFNKDGIAKGVVVLNVYGDYFLSDIRRARRQGEIVVLVNEEGDYLAHPDRSKEFAFMFGRNDDFYRDYPEIPKEILSGTNRERFESDNQVFSFQHIYPTESSFEINKASEKIFGENPEDKYFWTMVSISDKSKIDMTAKIFKESYLFPLLSSGIIVSIIIILIFAINPKNKSINKSK